MTDDPDVSPPLYFAELHMEGAEFEGARLPVESLTEFQRYKTIVLEAAVLDWRTKHPDEPLPDDFRPSFNLVLAEVKDGSATSVLDRPVKTPYDEYYDSGRAEFEREFRDLEVWLAEQSQQEIAHTTENGRPAPVNLEAFPLLRVPDFTEFGSSLPSGSAFQIQSPSSPQPIEVTEQFREQARPLAEELRAPAQEQLVVRSDLTSRVDDVAGRLVALNADTKSFTFASLLFGRLNARYRDPALTADLKKFLESESNARVIRIRGELRIRDEQPEHVLSVTEATQLEVDNEPWAARIIELASLHRGWSDGDAGGDLIAFTALDAARAILTSAKDSGKHQPGIFPTEEGGTLLEWATPDFVTSVEISPDLEFELFDLNVATHEVTNIETRNMEEAKSFVKGTVR